MSLFRVLLAIFFPPLAVIDKGCGSFLIVFLLSACGWAPGIIGALVILNRSEQ
ncbi:MAG: YqaE/Pmp3 family membrane protein [Alistipes sp.]|nr:YqaE/Pmp3 family membrane protein [Alistipes sp.]